MTPRPTIFISAVSKELKSARQLVSNTLQFLGYEPVWQDIFGTEQGDLRAMLREKIDGCKGIVQLVGNCYGAEPPAPDEQFGRVSYTQYEALYARQRGKKVWYLFLDNQFPMDAHEPEPEERQALQADYRRRLRSQSQLYHPLNSREALETSVLKLRNDLTRLRRGVTQWAAAVILLLVIIAGVVVWLEHGQRQESKELTAMKEEMAKLREGVMQYADTQTKVRQSQPGQSAAEVQQRTYDALAKQLGVDPKVLQEKLPQLARELQTAPNATTYERANAAFVSTNYVEAERLALVAADEAQKAIPPNTVDAIKALELAGTSADARIEYGDALRHYRDAAQLTDRLRDPMQWARQQWNIAYALEQQGQYAEAEKVFRGALEEYRRGRGEEDPDVLSLRMGLANAFYWEAKYAHAEAVGAGNGQFERAQPYFKAKYAEAEAEYRDVLKLEEKVFGPEHPATFGARTGLANVLAGERNFDEAETEYRDVLKFEEQVHGPEHPDTLATRMGLAGVLYGEGKDAEAETQYRDVLKLQEKVLGPEHPDTLMSCYDLALCLSDQGKNYEAMEFAQRAAEGASKVLGTNSPTTLEYEKIRRELQTIISPPRP